MPLSREIIDRTLASPQGEGAYAVCEALLDAGHEAWWVGGAVRDMLLGAIPEDIDIATSATPEQVRAIFPEADLSAAALGAAKVEKRGRTFELTTFRTEDEASDGRRPETVTFGSRDDDAARRDFTVNCLYWQPISRELSDSYAGEKDLSERLVRFIGEPVVRIRHDALRLLRAIRLRAAIDGQYEPTTHAALRSEASLLAGLSGPRVLQELEKLLAGPSPDRALRDWEETGALEVLLPELRACRGIAQPRDYHREGDVLEHLLHCVASFRVDDGADVRLAALLHDAGKVVTFALEERIRFDGHASASAEIAEAILTRLQCPVRRREKIEWLVRHHMHMVFLELSEERKAHWYFHPWFAELLQLFRLDIAGTDPSDYGLLERIIHDRDVFLDAHPRPEKPLLDGEAIMTLLGLRPGAEVGRLTRELLLAQTRKEVTTKKEAIAFLESLGRSAEAQS
ncbi:MAG: CCA tRNA nucleotidyltransferase [Candidatus Peribacteraceae bacterium]|nr:CCA tRNA nucleotidyltransferase [Candidatus Peribacteraceae bacterium]